MQLNEVRVIEYSKSIIVWVRMKTCRCYIYMLVVGRNRAYSRHETHVRVTRLVVVSLSAQGAQNLSVVNCDCEECDSVGLKR